jgi:hypothetical protein
VHAEAQSKSPVSSVVGQDRMPDRVLSLITLGHLDYVDLFTVAAPDATAHSAEEWARAVLERSPLAHSSARRFWRLIGLRLGPPQATDHVGGWEIAARGNGWIRLRTASWYMAAQAICVTGEGQVSVSLSLRYRSIVAKAVWALIARQHQRALSVMLRQAVRVMAAGGGGALSTGAVPSGD